MFSRLIRPGRIRGICGFGGRRRGARVTESIVIETARHTAGVAVREQGGYRFYAADAVFQPLDNHVFRGLRALYAAVASLSRSPGDAPSEEESPPQTP